MMIIWEEHVGVQYIPIHKNNETTKSIFILIKPSNLGLIIFYYTLLLLLLLGHHKNINIVFFFVDLNLAGWRTKEKQFYYRLPRTVQ